MNHIIRYSSAPVLEPQPGCDWANKMVLNPAITKDPESSTLHMLFRATGPWSQKRRGASHDPYPIFLGYAKSEDNGETWEPDFSKPALAPVLGWEDEELFIRDINGQLVRNYANGCIEDPRFFELDGDLYVSAACRVFPPGPYWLDNEELITRFMHVPEWAQHNQSEEAFYQAARTNDTVTVLFKVDLASLKSGRYEEAFCYVCPLSEGHVSDNRDVFPFSEKMMIDGKMQYLMLHRPMNPKPFPQGDEVSTPSIYMAAAERLEDFASPRATHQLLATSIFDWEENRIGASWPPLPIGDKEWLVSYHGKKDEHFGYTQSFMIVREQEDGFPQVVHRCPDRMMFAQQDWEMPEDFPTPCLFTTGGIVVGEQLIMAYGAADQKVGIAWADYPALIEHIRKYDERGKQLDAHAAG